LWDFGDSATSTEEDPIYAYSAIGVYDVTFTVTDEDGNSNVCSTTATITEEPVENEEPTISCTFDGTTGIVNEPVTLEVEATDSDGTIEQYAWDFGDSATDSTTEDTTEHTYTTANTYTVTVTATDDDGDSASCSGVVIITEEPTEENEEPVALCNGPYEAYVGETITFDGSDSYDMDGYLTSASWNFGDSAFASAVSFTGALTEEELQAEHAYDEAGVFTVTLTVFDEDSAYNTCETTATITEEPVEPVDNPAIAVASANPESGEPTLWVQFSSEGSSGDEPLSYYWTFGDGETSTRANPGHYYEEEGTYTAVLTIVDADGDSDSDSVTITVSDELENLAGRHYYIDGIAMSNDGIVNAGDTLELYVGTENIAGIDKERVAFNAIIQELGIYETTTEFDLDAGDKEVAVLYLEIPADTMPGIYNVRITISDDDVKRIAYRDIIVTA
jgi:PKD repeat protein